MSCGYPEFIYVAEDGHGGGSASSTQESSQSSTTATGMHATTTHSSTQSSSSTGTGGAGGEGGSTPTFQVTCGDDGTNHPAAKCARGVACCFAQLDGSCDECEPATGCGTDNGCTSSFFVRLMCNDADDCPDTNFCCLTVDTSANTLTASCTTPSHCFDDPSGNGYSGCNPTTLVGTDECITECTQTGYPGYHRCR
jgi:hypothetical protein